MNKQNTGRSPVPAKEGYFPVATARINSGGLVTTDWASRTQHPGPTIGLRGTLKK